MSEHTEAEMLFDIARAIARGPAKPEPSGLLGSDAWTELPTVMTNLDHSVDRGIEARLRAEPKTFARYAGWDFNGLVTWDGAREVWRCEVWRYNEPVEILDAGTLDDLMAAVSGKYGWD